MFNENEGKILKSFNEANKSVENRLQDVNSLKGIDFVAGAVVDGVPLKLATVTYWRVHRSGRVTVPHEPLPPSAIKHKSGALGKSTDA